GSVAEAAAVLGAATFDIVIVDYSLGDGTALDVLALVEGLPVVVATGTGNEAVAVNALKAGAYDYLIKDLDRNYLKIMPMTIENALRRHRAEEKIKRFYDELSDRVRERTRELDQANRDLRNALALAEAGIRARGEFLANITHELVTPLNSIIGYSQIMLDGLGGPLTDKQRQYATAILQGGERLNEAYSQIIQVVGLEAGERAIWPTRFKLKELLESSLLMMKERAAGQGVGLTLSTMPPPDTEIEADRTKLGQVMFSLLDNAVKFTPAGGSVCVGACLTGAEGGESIEISIADTGIGIKEADMLMLFQYFHQLEPANVKKYRGTGLGLVLAQKLLALHGGRIWVESEFGKGSTFRFTIPVRQGRDKNSRQAS
ncbi:MAG: two component system histidine kinase, partial [uncultured bacterium]